MGKSIRLAPPNAMFFLEDASGGISPEVGDRETHIWANDTTIILGCLPDVDGDTDLTVEISSTEAPSGSPRLDCVIQTPTRRVQVTTSGLELLMEFQVASKVTRVQVWTNEARFPDRIFVLLG